LTWPEFGTLSGIAPNVTYTPELGYLGDDIFSYKSYDGQAESEVAQVDITVGVGGNGLEGWYYHGMDFNDLVLVRSDATVDFNWGGGAPAAGMNADNFSVRWTGQVLAQYDEVYTFYTVSDDGVRLWVNGQLLIDNWTDHAPTEDSATIMLSAGQKYDIVMEYYENAWGAVARLLWSSASTPKQVIPQGWLYHIE
jgi:hypothetical protein